MWQAVLGLTESLFRHSGNRQKWPVLVAGASLACAIGPGAAQPDPMVWVRSHNASEVDVFLMCGYLEAKWIGVVPAKESAAFELAAEDASCPSGLNFFLVRQGRGYWAGPVRAQGSSTIELVIEKYAGLSTARSLSD